MRLGERVGKRTQRLGAQRAGVHRASKGVLVSGQGALTRTDREVAPAHDVARRPAGITAILLCGALLAGCASGLPDERRYGFSLPVRPAPAVAVSGVPPSGAKPTVTRASSTYQLVEASGNTDAGAADNSFLQIEAIHANTGRALWRTPLPAPKLVSIHDRKVTSFTADATLLVAGERILATYRLFIPPQHERDGRGVSAARFHWEFAIVDATSGRLIRHQRLALPATEMAFVYVGELWFLTDSTRQQTTRLDPATGEPRWSYPGIYRFSPPTANALGLYRHILGDRWSAAVLDAETGRELFAQSFPDLPMQTLQGVAYRNGTAYVALGAQYDFNVELGARYQHYTVAFEAGSPRPIWRTAFSAKP